MKKYGIALQLPNRKRIVENLPGSISLWEMLLYFEPQAGINIVSSPDEPYSYPILTFMNRKFSSPSAFKSATISSVGAEGGLFKLELGENKGETPRDLGLLQQTKEESETSITGDESSNPDINAPVNSEDISNVSVATPIEDHKKEDEKIEQTQDITTVEEKIISESKGNLEQKKDAKLNDAEKLAKIEEQKANFPIPERQIQHFTAQPSRNVHRNGMYNVLILWQYQLTSF